MAGEYTAGTLNWKSTVVCNHPRLGRCRMNATSYDPATCGPIIEPATQPPPTRSVSDAPLKNPKLDEQGRRIADMSAPMHRA
jgi:hypothetical protein